jgi:hypothetical protein
VEAEPRCPQCGGSRVRPITPGYYECLEDVVIGGVPPEVTGLPHHIPDLRPCGARFHVGAAGASVPCAFCGLDSIGTCEGGCERRLCGNHGTAKPPFLCRECIVRRQAESDRAERERVEARVLAHKRELEEISERLDSAESPTEIAELVRRGGAGLGAEALGAAWKRLIDGGSLGPPPYDVVTVTFTYRRPFGNMSKELSRVGAWRFRPELQRHQDWFLLDVEGTRWDDCGAPPGTSKSVILPPWGSGIPTTSIAIEAGAKVDARRRQGWNGWSLSEGIPVKGFESSGSERLVEAVAGAIESTRADTAPTP